MKEPKVKLMITIRFMNGDELECPGVWDSTENQVSLELVYEKFHTHYPMCNIKSITYQYGDKF
jgi:hypothetical protein